MFCFKCKELRDELRMAHAENDRLHKKLTQHLKLTPGLTELMEDYYRDPWGQEARLELAQYRAKKA